MYKVVIVEDELTVRRGIILTIDWSQLGCVIAGEADNGEEGLALIQRIAPELVITDVKMPYMDGVEMIERLREGGYQGHFLILTAYGDFKYAQKALRLGVSDYLLKPMQEGELEAAVARLTDKLLPKQEASEKTQEILKLSADAHNGNYYVEKACRLIRERYREEITISLAAESLGISESYLSRIFKKETGYTFTNFLIYYRMQLAMGMLRERKKKVYEVADALGYTDTAYFSAQFKKITGQSPSEFQERG